MTTRQSVEHQIDELTKKQAEVNAGSAVRRSESVPGEAAATRLRSNNVAIPPSLRLRSFWPDKQVRLCTGRRGHLGAGTPPDVDVLNTLALRNVPTQALTYNQQAAEKFR